MTSVGSLLGRIGRYAFGVLLGFGLVFVLFLSTGALVSGSAPLSYLVWVLLTIAAVGFAWMLPRIGVPQTAGFGWVLFAAALGFAVYSILTGYQNGYTDEPYTTPHYVSILLAGHNPYSYPLVLNYDQYGTPIHSVTRYVYFPLLMFWQVPGLNYKFFMVLCWTATIWLLRRDAFAMITMAQPLVAVLAASGYNDYPVLLLLTVAFVGLGSRKYRWAEILALGSKQFANVITVVYYAVRRDWRNVGVTVGVTAAFIVPFLIWDFFGTLCSAIIYSFAPSCPMSRGGPGIHTNYSLYVLWGVAVFHRPLMERYRRFRAPRSGTVSPGPAGDREPSVPEPHDGKAVP
jgi:hypothetical protein